MDAYLHGIDGNRIDNDISASGDLTAGDSWDSINDWKTFVSGDGSLCASDVSVPEVPDVSDVVPDVTDEIVTTTHLYAAEECTVAQEALAASTNALEKITLKASCEVVCAEFEGETCGFLVKTHGPFLLYY